MKTEGTNENPTPRPWQVSPKPPPSYVDHGMRGVAETTGWLIWIPKERVSELKFKAEANARHIVKCVNLHDELLEACKAILPYLMAESPAYCEPGPEHAHYHASKKVREAIVKAEGR